MAQGNKYRKHRNVTHLKKYWLWPPWSHI